MYRAHKIRIDCTKEQHSLLMQTAGCARYAYNWGLEKWGKQYEAWKADSTRDHRESHSSLETIPAVSKATASGCLS